MSEESKYCTDCQAYHPATQPCISQLGRSEMAAPAGYADKDALFTLSEKLLVISKKLEQKGDVGAASNAWIISAELFRMACRHNEKGQP